MVRRDFGDLLALFDACSAGAKDLVAGATDLLVADVDGPAVAALASEVVSGLTSPFRVDELLTAARAEVDMPHLGAEGTAIRASQAQIRRWQRGELTIRELTRWAHRYVGHDGPAELRDLVFADHMWDDLGAAPTATAPMDDHLAQVTMRILSYPDPWER